MNEALEMEIARLRKQADEGERTMTQLRELSAAYAELAFRFLDEKTIVECSASLG